MSVAGKDGLLGRLFLKFFFFSRYLFCPKKNGEDFYGFVIFLHSTFRGDLPDHISLDTVMLACCQQHQWPFALGLGDQQHSMESLEQLVTACEAQLVHRVACGLLLDLRESTWDGITSWKKTKAGRAASWFAKAEDLSEMFITLYTHHISAERRLEMFSPEKKAVKNMQWSRRING